MTDTHDVTVYCKLNAHDHRTAVQLARGKLDAAGQVTSVVARPVDHTEGLFTAAAHLQVAAAEVEDAMDQVRATTVGEVDYSVVKVAAGRANLFAQDWPA